MIKLTPGVWIISAAIAATRAAALDALQIERLNKTIAKAWVASPRSKWYGPCGFEYWFDDLLALARADDNEGLISDRESYREFWADGMTPHETLHLEYSYCDWE